MPPVETTELELWNRALSRVGDDRIVPEASVVLLSITAAAPPVATTSGAHGYLSGDRIVFQQLIGGAQFEDRVFEVRFLTTTTFELVGEDGTTGTASAGGFVARLPNLKRTRLCADAWKKIRDEVLRAHPWNSVVRRGRLARQDVAQSITAISQAAITAIAATTPITITAAGHGLANGDEVWISGTQAPSLNNRAYVVAGVAGATFQLVGTVTLGAFGVGGVSGRNPPRVTVALAHGLTAGDLVLISGTIGAADLSDRWFSVGAVPSTTTFDIVQQASQLASAYTSGGSVRKALPPLVPDSGYGARYTVPADCLRVLDLEDYTGLWELEGDQVLTDNTDLTQPLRYVALIVDPDLWDSQLRTVLIARLAAEIAEELTQSRSKKELLLGEYQQMLSEARRVDAQEQSPVEFEEDAWVRARL